MNDIDLLDANRKILDTQVDKAIKMLNDVGLAAFAMKDTNRLLLVGGLSFLNEDEIGYEIEEPTFSIFFENGKYIATVDDMHDINHNEPKIVGADLESIEEAVQFIMAHVAEYIFNTKE